MVGFREIFYTHFREKISYSRPFMVVKANTLPDKGQCVRVCAVVNVVYPQPDPDEDHERTFQASYLPIEDGGIEYARRTAATSCGLLWSWC